MTKKEERALAQVAQRGRDARLARARAALEEKARTYARARQAWLCTPQADDAGEAFKMAPRELLIALGQAAVDFLFAEDFVSPGGAVHEGMREARARRATP
jgi:hypothetical protein